MFKKKNIKDIAIKNMENLFDRIKDAAIKRDAICHDSYYDIEAIDAVFRYKLNTYQKTGNTEDMYFLLGLIAGVESVGFITYGEAEELSAQIKNWI